MMHVSIFLVRIVPKKKKSSNGLEDNIDQNVSSYLNFQGKEGLGQKVNYVTDLDTGSLIGFLGLGECFH